MTELILNAPVVGLDSPYPSWGNEESVKSTIKDIWSKNREAIEFASMQSNIPKEVIVAFIMTESRGDAFAKRDSNTQGLMQWNKAYAKLQLERELRENRLSAPERKKLEAYGIKFNDKGIVSRDLTLEDQMKPELNILIGSIILGQLIDTDWGTENGEPKLDRVAVVYNLGAYGDAGKKARSKRYKTAVDLANAVNVEGKKYINRILSKNGAIDIIKKNNLLS